ncbi:protein-disulfide reductase DsbD domain-containing protein [Sphingosinicella sp. YJ22]|uniref:protein-disulfide reductase DsbD family protein n=1 Tax=Sphingosinicella sp. YJ22 TaxID=1104780 RepID=UPI00140D9EBA|nr:protein-disulfide reductase DsbD domain-containing protein [Sphingosinicella sp. YJ22]
MIRLLAFLLTLLIAVPAAAQPLAAGRNHIAAELVAESATPAPGQSVTIAFSFTPEPGWHGYWLNPGDAGQAARVEWQLPDGAEVGALRYPVPERLIIQGLMNHVFNGPHAFLATLRLPAGIAPGTAIPVRARIDYLACTDEICVPERANLSLDLRAGDGSVAGDQRTRFDAWRAALPRPLGSEGAFEFRDGRLRVAVPLPASVGVNDPHLFAATPNALIYAADQAISRNGDMLIVETQAGSQANGLAGFEGLIAIGEGQGLAFAARPGPVPPAGEPIRAVVSGGSVSLIVALLGAILGGLILNIMPCVFPILSLKALSLARAGETPQKARAEALAYSAGVIVTCLALGALLLVLRASGEAVGWAFQLQEPRVVLLLLLLTTAVALNLAGLFRLPGLSLDRADGGRTSAFATGALAAFVATPCTGPFMAAALGATLVLPTTGALAVFGGLGLGLALPFLLLGFVPALRRRIPRPGPWMVKMQRLLSIPMFLTALGLAWVLGRQTGVDGMALGLAAALALGLLLWWIGARSERNHRLAAAAAMVAVVAGSLLVVRTGETAPRSSATLLGAEPFSETRLSALRAERRPVFVYFTADWCLSCKVNERGPLASAAVTEAFRAKGVRVLEGDWTLGDAEIGRFLERHGRSGVPLYLYYAPGREPLVLPQILTASALTALAG